MLIKDIKFRRIRKLAKKRTHVHPLWNEEGGDMNILKNAFDWNLSPERYMFWSLIDKEEYTLACNLRPDLFKPTKAEIKEAYDMHLIKEQYRIKGSLAG